MSDLDGEWLEALGAEEEAKDEDDKSDDAIVEDTSEEKEEDVEETKDDDSDNASDDTSDDDSDSDSDDTDDSSDAPAEEEKAPEVNETKEAIKEAIQEIDNAKEAKANTLQTLKQEVAETLYPEGINRQLKDSDGDPIKGIDDLTSLVNPRTGELFTDEEAGSWLLNAQQKLNKDVEQVESFIEQVAEVNANITDGAKRVADKYGPLLSADDKLRTRLLEAYDKTLVKDPKTGVTINNPIDVVEFFDIALESRMDAKLVADQATEEKAKVDAKKAAKNNQSDRSDFKPSGKAENIDPQDKEWAEAIKSYEEGA